MSQPQPMVTLRSPDGAVIVCINCPCEGDMTPTADEIAECGYPGWTLISEHADRPQEQLSAKQIEDARLNRLTNAELMAEVRKLIGPQT